MARIFNTAGLCFPEKHYVVDPLRQMEVARSLIRDEKYFVIHAPRQTGKTTAMRALMNKLNGEGEYITLHFSCENASVAGENYAEGNYSIVKEIMRVSSIFLSEEECPTGIPDSSDSLGLLTSFLSRWAGEQKKPIVLLIDEIDSLSDLSLLSVLRQLRNGYQTRPGNFPSSVALIGLKNIRDYKVKLRKEQESLGTASPFNIVDKSLTLRNFNPEEIRELYLQHTKETGQPFEEKALELVYYYTKGQPWLTNALARECVEEGSKAGTKEPINEDDILKAKETIIQRRDTHIDSLISKLREPRVRKVLGPILEGSLLDDDVLDDDLEYVRDLGLVTRGKGLEIANPIYQEVIPRALNYKLQLSIPWVETWLDKDGKLDWPLIWDNFLSFWREHGEALIKAAPYHEIAPHLVLMAYLQRISNGKGEIIREYAIGSRRIDLLVTWPYEAGGKQVIQKEAIELKVWRPDMRQDPLSRGLEKLERYLATLGLKEGTLVIFDRRPDLPYLDERTTREFVEYNGKKIQVIRG